MEGNNSITLSAVIQRNDKKFLANKLGDEMVMMNMESGDFVSMNKVGADIWDLSEQPIAVKKIIQQLIKRYEITEDQCAKETLSFLQMSVAQGIFTYHNTTNA